MTQSVKWLHKRENDYSEVIALFQKKWWPFQKKSSKAIETCIAGIVCWEWDCSYNFSWGFPDHRRPRLMRIIQSSRVSSACLDNLVNILKSTVNFTYIMSIWKNKRIPCIFFKIFDYMMRTLRNMQELCADHT